MKKILLAGIAALAFGGVAHADGIVGPKAGTIKLDIRLTDISPSESGNLLNGSAHVFGATTGTDTGLDVDVNDNITPTIGLEYYFSPNVSLEVIAGTGVHTVKVPGVKTATTGIVSMANDKVAEVAHLPPTITAKYHFAPEAQISPYVGAGLTYIWFYSEDSKNNIDVDLKDGFGWALQAGIDFQTASKWSYNLDVKKIFFETDATVGATAGTTYVANVLSSKVTLDPWVVSVGFGYKF